MSLFSYQHLSLPHIFVLASCWGQKNISWFLVAFLWILVTKRIFLFVCWPCISSLGEMSIQVLCPFLHLVIFLLLDCKDSLYILYKRIRYMLCQHSLSLYGSSFPVCPWSANSFNFKESFREFLLHGILIPWPCWRRHSLQKAIKKNPELLNTQALSFKGRKWLIPVNPEGWNGRV